MMYNLFDMTLKFIYKDFSEDFCIDIYRDCWGRRASTLPGVHLVQIHDHSDPGINGSAAGMSQKNHTESWSHERRYIRTRGLSSPLYLTEHASCRAEQPDFISQLFLARI